MVQIHPLLPLKEEIMGNRIGSLKHVVSLKDEIASLRAELALEIEARQDAWAQVAVMAGGLAAAKAREDVARSGYDAAIRTANWQESTNGELNALRSELSDYKETGLRLMRERDEARAELATAKALLRELHGLVLGECPRLLNEDSGGDSGLAIRIDAATGSKG